jgi:hypothetical protein
VSQQRWGFALGVMMILASVGLFVVGWVRTRGERQHAMDFQQTAHYLRSDTGPPPTVQPDPLQFPPGNLRIPPDTPFEEQARVSAARRMATQPVVNALNDGSVLLGHLHAIPADMAAAMEPEVESWLLATQDALGHRADLLARFNHITSRARREHEKARPRLEAVLTQGTDALHDFLRELQ